MIPISKSKKRRNRRRKLEGRNSPFFSHLTVNIPDSNVETISIISESSNLFHNEMEKENNLSNFPIECQTESKIVHVRLNWIRRCVNHIRYIAKSLHIEKISDENQLSAMQMHPQMYFRNIFILRAMNSSFDESLIHESSVTFEECKDDCMSVIINLLQHYKCPRIHNNPLMIYNKRIVDSFEFSKNDNFKNL